MTAVARDVLAALAVEIARLQTRVDALEQCSGVARCRPRDDDDQRVVRVLAEAVERTTSTLELPSGVSRFRVRDVRRLAQLVPDLHAALRAADATSSGSLAKLFRRVEGQNIAGVTVTRAATRSGTLIWRLTRW